MKKIILAFLLFASFFANSQTCTVLSEALKGNYEGECKKNKADGIGTATGEDTYTGKFRNGYPDGTGKYIWKNGDWYEGQWKKGLREGKGIMHLISSDSKDSLLAGYWKKDKYIGKYETPYIIHNKTADIVQVNITMEKSRLREIIITLESTRGGAMAIGRQIPKPTITSIDVVNGLFINQMDHSNMPKTNSTAIRGVEFPFRARFSIGSELIEIEFLEEGNYAVDIKINQ